jgi:hypothetical protein
VRETALGSYLDLAEKRLEAEPEQARAMLERAFDLATESGLRGRALIGLARAGGGGVAAKIEAARNDPLLAADAARAAVAYGRGLGKSGKKEEAVAVLMGVVSAGAGREIVREAVKSLEELGVDPTFFQQAQGLVTGWWLLGPFPNEGGKGFQTAYPPEEEVRLDGTQKDERGRDRKWEKYRTTREDGVVDLAQIFRRTQNVCAYAYTEIEAARAQDVLLKFGSDDGVACWLNGEKVHANNATRPLAIDQDTAKAALRAGKNRLLVKITQGGGEWEFVVRLATPEGRPLDLTRLARE